MDAKQKGSKPNAIKNLDSDESSLSSSSFGEQPPDLRTPSLDISPLSDNKTSFQIDGEFDRICHSLGLSGPEDFAIPTALWEARKVRSSSDSRAWLLKDFNSAKVDPDILGNDVVSAQFDPKEFESSKLKNKFGNRDTVFDGIKLRLGDDDDDDDDDDDGGGGGGGDEFMSLGDDVSENFTFTSDDVSQTCTFTSDYSSSTPDDNSIFRRTNISSWQKGELLGRGSLGAVYEGVTE